MYVYCYNNPVNDRDDCGDLSWWKKLLIGVAVIVAVVAVAAITVATAGAGSAIAAIAIGAAKGAIVGAVVGAAQGAVIGGTANNPLVLRVSADNLAKGEFDRVSLSIGLAVASTDLTVSVIAVLYEPRYTEQSC